MFDRSDTAETGDGTASARELTFKFSGGPDGRDIPYQAPDLPPHFVPRAELLAIKRLLLQRPSSSLAPLTLHGPPGAGKTTLVAALAHDREVLDAFPDGVLWVSLGDQGDPQHAQSIWGRALGDDLSHLPDIASRSAALRSMMRSKRYLLVVDNVSDIEQIKALNVGGPGCARLITTDYGEDIALGFKSRRYAINRMLEDEALHLLTEWAGMLPDIYLPTVKEIIKRLTHSPLALALVGAQARQGITWLRLLEVLREDQGIIANLDLNDPEVRDNGLGLVVNLVLSRFGGAQLQRSSLLGAFAAGTGMPFSVEAAAACWNTDANDAADMLNQLVGASLVQDLPGDLHAIHRALRPHLRRAAMDGPLKEAAKRIGMYYLSLVESSSSDPTEIDAQLGQIMDCFGEMMQINPDTASVFADALMAYFERRGLWANMASLARRVIDDTEANGDVMRQHSYLGDLGYALTMLGDLNGARESFGRNLQISRELEDPVGEASALNNIGAIDEREGSYDQALSYYQQSLRLRERLGVRQDIAETLNNVAGVLYWQERYDESLNTFQRVLDMYNVTGDRSHQAQTLLNIGTIHEALGSDFEAMNAYQQSLAIYTNLGEKTGQAQVLNNLGIAYFNQGEMSRALSHFKRSLALKEELGDRSGQASTLNNIALLYENTGTLTLALEHYQQSFEILTALEDSRADFVQENIDQLRQRMKEAG